MTPPVALDLTMVARLELVVALLDDPLAQFGKHLFDLQAGHQLSQQRRQQAQVAHVRLNRSGDRRVLHLDRHLAPVVRPTAVHLPDAGRRRGLGVDRGEQTLGTLAPFAGEHVAHLLPVDGGNVVAQRAQARLQVRRLILVETGKLDRREDLPGLHRRSAHHRELIDERIDRRDDPVATPSRTLVGGPARVQPIARPASCACRRLPVRAARSGRRGHGSVSVRDRSELMRSPAATGGLGQARERNLNKTSK